MVCLPEETRHQARRSGLPESKAYGPIRDWGVLEGTIIRVGGQGDRVPIWLQDGDTVYKTCTALRPVARRLAPHFDAGLLRLYGRGSWMRLATGAWLMQSFEIKDFDVLDEEQS